jgi:hypothetical protein
MSELRADTITGSDGTGPVTLTKQSAAKAWANYAHATGLRESFNISTFTDNGTGDYSLSLTSSFSNANYAVGGISISGGDRTVVLDTASTASIIRTNNYDTSAGSAIDGEASFSAHGDLA